MNEVLQDLPIDAEARIDADSRIIASRLRVMPSTNSSRYIMAFDGRHFIVLAKRVCHFFDRDGVSIIEMHEEGDGIEIVQSQGERQCAGTIERLTVWIAWYICCAFYALLWQRQSACDQREKLNL